MFIPPNRIILDNIDINTLYEDISKKYIPQGTKQVVAFARSMRKESDAKTVRNIWDYCRNNFTYKFDGYPESKEIIRLPNASFEDKAIDCEDFAILVGSILCNLKIPFIVRMAAYANEKICHIYIVAIIKGRKVIIDPCNAVFNKEDKGEFWDTYFDEKGKRTKSYHTLGKAQSIGKIEDIKDKEGFVKAMMQSLRDNKKENKVSSQNLAKTFGITVQMEVKELTELAIVYVARELASQYYKTYSQKFQEIVKLYQNQVRLNHRSSESVMFQQYSTPSPIGFMMGIFCRIFQKGGNYFEPSAGNGLLTIAGSEEDFTVNEISELRKNNLINTLPAYKKVYSFDGSNINYPKEYRMYHKFDAVITNPPFGQLPHKVDFGKGESQIKVNKLDHLMALLALDCMKDDGKCAIILGGHTSYDSEGRISARTSGGSQASGDRYFFNYLYHNYNVKDVIFIDGDLYARQGTSFDVRVVLIDGRKQTPSGFAPLKDNSNTEVVKTFEDYFERVRANLPIWAGGFKVGDYIKNKKLKTENRYHLDRINNYQVNEINYDDATNSVTLGLECANPQIDNITVSYYNYELSTNEEFEKERSLFVNIDNFNQPKFLQPKAPIEPKPTKTNDLSLLILRAKALKLKALAITL